MILDIKIKSRFSNVETAFFIATNARIVRLKKFVICGLNYYR